VGKIIVIYVKIFLILLAKNY